MKDDRIKFNGRWFRWNGKYYRNKDAGHLHRAIYESVYGPVLAGYHVHHIDGNGRNNELSNLRAMLAEEHAAIHYPDKQQKMTEGCKAWNTTEEASNTHRENALAQWERVRAMALSVKCAGCGKAFQVAHPSAAYCSKGCYHKAYADRHKEHLKEYHANYYSAHKSRG